MEWYKLFEEHLNKAVAALLAMLFLSLIGLLKKVPKYLREKISESRNIKALEIGGAISDEVDRIQSISSAIYNHIIFYHDGEGDLKKDKDIHMTIKWERTGHVCDDCMEECPLKTRIPKLKPHWNNEEVTDEWREVIRETVHLKGKVNSNYIKDVSEDIQDIWKESSIFTYKEFLIKHKSFGFYTLGLSYCKRLEDIDIPEGTINKSINKIKELL